MKLIIDKHTYDNPHEELPSSIVYDMDSVEVWDALETGKEEGIVIGFSGDGGEEFDLFLDPESASKLTKRLIAALLRGMFGKDYNA